MNEFETFFRNLMQRQGVRNNEAPAVAAPVAGDAGQRLAPIDQGRAPMPLQLGGLFGSTNATTIAPPRLTPTQRSFDAMMNLLFFGNGGREGGARPAPDIATPNLSAPQFQEAYTSPPIGATNVIGPYNPAYVSRYLDQLIRNGGWGGR